jgi:hypothetical protein
VKVGGGGIKEPPVRPPSRLLEAAKNMTVAGIRPATPAERPPGSQHGPISSHLLTQVCGPIAAAFSGSRSHSA